MIVAITSFFRSIVVCFIIFKRFGVIISILYSGFIVFNLIIQFATLHAVIIREFDVFLILLKKEFHFVFCLHEFHLLSMTLTRFLFPY